MRILKILRERSGLTLRQVEDATSISNAYLSQLECGKVKNPSAKALYILSKLYLVSIEDLLIDSEWLSKIEIKPIEMNPTLDERITEIELRLTKLEMKNIVFS